MKKVLFVLSVTHTGGVLTSLINLLHEINKESFDCYVISLDNIKNKEIVKNASYINAPKSIQYLISGYKESIKGKTFFSKIRIVLIKCFSKIVGFRKALNFFCIFNKQRILFDYAISFSNDIFLNKSFAGGANSFVLNSVKSNIKIGWIHNDANKYGFSRKNSFTTYKRFDYIVNVSYACKKIFDTLFPEFIPKSRVVWNMIDFEGIKNKSFETNIPAKNGFILLTVARMDNQQKRFDRVIDVSSMLMQDNLNFYWYLVGDGPDIDYLKQYAHEKRVSDRLIFLGALNNPYPFMRNADLFVLTSEYESFGIVLLEAMSLGCPVISTNFDAVNEIIKSQEMGLVVKKDVNSLYTAVKQMSNFSVREKYRNFLIDYHFTNEQALRQLSELLGE